MSFKRVGWVYDDTSFNLKDPNARIKSLIHSNMNLMGWESRVVPKQKFHKYYDAMVFCSVDGATVELVEACKQQGVKTLFHHMENILGFDFQRTLFNAVDAVVCSSATLAHITESQGYGKCYHIDDPADDVFYEPLRTRHRELSVAYAGGNLGLAELYRPHVEKAGWRYSVLTYPNDGRDYFREADDFGGNPYWWLDEYRRCHVALCAHDFNAGQAKSVIKVATAYANNLIPLAAAIPSYRTAVKHNDDGFIYHSFEDVTRILIHLNDKKVREQLTAGLTVAERYRSKKITLDWMNLIDSLSW